MSIVALSRALSGGVRNRPIAYRAQRAVRKIAWRGCGHAWRFEHPFRTGVAATSRPRGQTWSPHAIVPDAATAVPSGLAPPRLAAEGWLLQGTVAVLGILKAARATIGLNSARRYSPARAPTGPRRRLVTPASSTLAGIEAAIAHDEATLADYRSSLARREAKGHDVAQARELVRTVERRLAMLRERRQIAAATEKARARMGEDGARDRAPDHARAVPPRPRDAGLDALRPRRAGRRRDNGGPPLRGWARQAGGLADRRLAPRLRGCRRGVPGRRQRAVGGAERSMTSTAITPAQCKAARKLVGWSVLELAHRAGTEPMALSRFEARRGMLSLDKLAAIRNAFEDAGVEFPNGAPRSRTRP